MTTVVQSTRGLNPGEHQARAKESYARLQKDVKYYLDKKIYPRVSNELSLQPRHGGIRCQISLEESELGALRPPYGLLRSTPITMLAGFCEYSWASRRPRPEATPVIKMVLPIVPCCLREFAFAYRPINYSRDCVDWCKSVG